MIDEAKQQAAIDYILGELSPAEATNFEKELAANQELREFTKGMMEAVASTALTATPARPRPELFSQIISKVNPQKRSRPKIVSFLPWAVAACLAIACLVLGIKEVQTSRELADLRGHDVLSQLQIAMLQSQVDAYAKTTGIIIWNDQRQQGVARLEHLPPPEQGHDYQLWIIDPKQPVPVSAGLVPMSTGEGARVEFKPVHPVTSAAKFAVSVEKTGGSDTPQGKIIFLSQ